MVIDFKNIEEQALPAFKGGRGELCVKRHVDEKCTISAYYYEKLRSGA